MTSGLPHHNQDDLPAISDRGFQSIPQHVESPATAGQGDRLVRPSDGARFDGLISASFPETTLRLAIAFLALALHITECSGDNISSESRCELLLHALIITLCPRDIAYTRAEIERGIRLVKSLPVITSRVPGWVGVRCDSEEMAIWLMRAIIVENIMVRRENDVLYLPAGPQFTVKREIKNVITSIAKTTHYWKNHLKERQVRE